MLEYELCHVPVPNVLIKKLLEMKQARPDWSLNSCSMIYRNGNFKYYRLEIGGKLRDQTPWRTRMAWEPTESSKENFDELLRIRFDKMIRDAEEGVEQGVNLI